MPRKRKDELEGTPGPLSGVIEIDGIAYPISAPPEELSEVQEQFCINYVMYNGNATKATLSIKGKGKLTKNSASVFGCDLLRRPLIRKRIAAIRQDLYRCRLQSSLLPITEELTKIATSNISDFLDGHLRLDAMRIRKAKNSGVISEISRTYGRTQKDSIKLYDKIAAARALLEMYFGKINGVAAEGMDDDGEPEEKVIITRPDNGRLPGPMN